MKILIQIIAWFFLLLYVFVSCKKDKEQVTATPPAPKVNKPPIAKAGPDLLITFVSCHTRGSAVLDGSLSTDPDNDPIYFGWRKISGPPGFDIQNSTQKNAYAVFNSAGDYAVELTVIDAGGLYSRDTVLINVKLSSNYQYDLDITFTSTFKFLNNEQDCYYTPCSYYDISIIEGKGIYLPIGEMNLYFSEYADTATSSYAANSYISIFRHTTGIYGTCNINLKKLFQQGGGAFNGSFIVEGGSSSNCDLDGFKNLAPLTISGNLDTAARTATVKIKGITYF